MGNITTASDPAQEAFDSLISDLLAGLNSSLDNVTVHGLQVTFGTRRDGFLYSAAGDTSNLDHMDGGDLLAKAWSGAFTYKPLGGDAVPLHVGIAKIYQNASDVFHNKKLNDGLSSGTMVWGVTYKNASEDGLRNQRGVTDLYGLSNWNLSPR